METFKTIQTYTFLDLFRESSITIVIIVVIYGVVLFWLPERLTTFSLLVPGLLLIIDFYNNASRQRLRQLTFDTDRNEIIISSKSLFSNIKQKTVSFEKARLEVLEEKSKLKLFEPLKLYILKDKMELFELNKSKDKLSLNTLWEIVRTAENRIIPVIHK